jgi:hypothetical protein
MTPAEQTQKKIGFELKEKRAEYAKKDGKKVRNGDVLRCPQGFRKNGVEEQKVKRRYEAN